MNISCNLKRIFTESMDRIRRGGGNMIFESSHLLMLVRTKKLLKTPVLLDLRNLYEPEKVKSLGFIYDGVGRIKNK